MPAEEQIGDVGKAIQSSAEGSYAHHRCGVPGSEARPYWSHRHRSTSRWSVSVRGRSGLDIAVITY